MQRGQSTPGTDGRVAHPAAAASPSAGRGGHEHRSAWFALQLFANREKKVEESLRNLGFETFLPTQKEEHRWSDRKKTVEKPLFPGYIFVRAQPEHLGGIVRIAGVLHVLGHGSEPEAIPDEQIEDVRRVLANCVPVHESPHVVGDRVRVARGPLAGIEGVVKRVAGEMRFSVGIELMKRSLTVRIDAADLASA